MHRLDHSALKHVHGPIAHTGEQTFPSNVYWESSDWEEAFFLHADGRIQAALSGMRFKLGGKHGDLYVFDRRTVLEGVVGAGNVVDAQGHVWGGFGRFRTHLLLPRRFLADAKTLFGDADLSLEDHVSALLRPILRSAMESVSENAADAPLPCSILEQRAAEAMRNALILHGFQLEHFEIVRFARTEE